MFLKFFLSVLRCFFVNFQNVLRQSSLFFFLFGTAIVVENICLPCSVPWQYYIQVVTVQITKKLARGSQDASTGFKLLCQLRAVSHIPSIQSRRALHQPYAICLSYTGGEVAGGRVTGEGHCLATNQSTNKSPTE
jgi:hypothetical protein